MDIWIVEGSTGEYSDHREWILCAFTTEAAANALVLQASARARELQQKYPASYWFSWDNDDGKERNEFDPQMEIDYTGVNYRTIKCELREG